jgi:hypothetical protein
VPPRAERCGNGNALLPAGIGHHNALGVLDHVPAASHRQTLGKGSKNLCRQRSGKGNGNGFGAALGRDQLFAQHFEIFLRVYP